MPVSIFPQAAAGVGGSVTDASTLLDQDNETVAVLEATTATPATVRASNFEDADGISDAGRSAAVLKVQGTWHEDTAAGDELELYVKLGSEDRVLLTTVSGEGVAGSTVEISHNVFGDIGTETEASIAFEVELVTTNATAQFDVAGVWLELEGDEAPPTVEELAVLLQAQADENFALLYAAAKDSLAAAFTAFGCKTAAEQTALATAVIAGLEADAASTTLQRVLAAEYDRTRREVARKIQPVEDGAPSD